MTPFLYSCWYIFIINVIFGLKMWCDITRSHEKYKYSFALSSFKCRWFIQGIFGVLTSKEATFGIVATRSEKNGYWNALNSTVLLNIPDRLLYTVSNRADNPEKHFHGLVNTYLQSTCFCNVCMEILKQMFRLYTFFWYSVFKEEHWK